MYILGWGEGLFAGWWLQSCRSAQLPPAAEAALLQLQLPPRRPPSQMGWREGQHFRQEAQIGIQKDNIGNIFNFNKKTKRLYKN